MWLAVVAPNSLSHFGSYFRTRSRQTRFEQEMVWQILSCSRIEAIFAIRPPSKGSMRSFARLPRSAADYSMRGSVSMMGERTSPTGWFHASSYGREWVGFQATRKEYCRLVARRALSKRALCETRPSTRLVLNAMPQAFGLRTVSPSKSCVFGLPKGPDLRAA